MPNETQPDPNQPPAPPVSTLPPEQPQGRNVMIPKPAFDKRIEQAKKSGRTAYQAELDTQAQTKGFANHVAMMAHLDTILRSPAIKAPVKPVSQATPPPAPPKNRNDHQAMAQFDREKAKLQRDKQQSDQRLLDEQKRRRRAERERDATEARSNLERIASRCGVKDVDYAIHLYTQACQGKSEEELGKMNEEEFFKGLRQGHAYIFGETVVPATTGTAGVVPGSHMPPSTAGTSAAAGQAGTIDVTKMNKQEYREYKRTRGYDRPVVNGRAS